MTMIHDARKHTAESITAKVAIRIYELKKLSKQQPSPGILERIKLKEKLLAELCEYLAIKNNGA